VLTTILAQGTSSTSSNAPGGAVLTFAFPIILFAVIATLIYYFLLSRPHARVPARRIVLETAASGAHRPAAVATGPATASGGGPAEPQRDTLADAAGGPGSVSGEAGESDQGTTEGTEASE
jgi:hypothetical protein